MANNKASTISNFSGADPRLDSVYAALAAPPRRAMLDRLASGPATAGELWDGLGITRPTVSKHLRVLEDARVIHRQREGRIHRFTLRAEALEPAAVWIVRYRTFWESRMDALASFLEEESQGGKRDGV